MSTNDIILAIFCALLVVYSLVVALVVPKRNPEFPRKLGAFFLVSAVLVGAMLSAVEFFGGETEPVHAAEPAEPGAPAEPAPPGEAPPPAETAPGEPAPPAEPPAGDAAAGKTVFVDNCGACHTLADAGTSGTVGPDLDGLALSFDLVHQQVVNGGGAMPPFGGTLDEQQINDVAAYVAQASAG